MQAVQVVALAGVVDGVEGAKETGAAKAVAVKAVAKVVAATTGAMEGTVTAAVVMVARGEVKAMAAEARVRVEGEATVAALEVMKAVAVPEAATEVVTGAEATAEVATEVAAPEVGVMVAEGMVAAEVAVARAKAGAAMVEAAMAKAEAATGAAAKEVAVTDWVVVGLAAEEAMEAEAAAAAAVTEVAAAGAVATVTAVMAAAAVASTATAAALGVAVVSRCQPQASRQAYGSRRRACSATCPVGHNPGWWTASCTAPYCKRCVGRSSPRSSRDRRSKSPTRERLGRWPQQCTAPRSSGRRPPGRTSRTRPGEATAGVASTGCTRAKGAPRGGTC